MDLSIIEELSKAYAQKHSTDTARNYQKENKELYNG